VLEAAFDVCYTIEEMVANITAKVTPRSAANQNSRQNALWALIDIGTIIADGSPTELYKQIRNNYYPDISENMLSVISCMTTEERHATRDFQPIGFNLIANLLRLSNLALSYCIFNRLGEVVDELESK
jgi:hypothetical protein